MKKSAKSKIKLSLHTETIRTLDERSMRGVAGASNFVNTCTRESGRVLCSLTI